MKLRISADGTVRGLWKDAIDWSSLGRVAVRRASHVEFCDLRQQWSVRAGRPKSWIRLLLQWALHRPFGEILYMADTREEALRWEQEYYGIGGPGWKAEYGNR